MPRLEVRELRPADLDAAAELLAARQRRVRERATIALPLGESFEAALPCRELIEKFVASPRTSSVVATSAGRVVGFLAGERQLFAPEDFAAIYAEPRSIALPLHAHAVAGDEDASELYEAMYGHLSGVWADGGFFVHNVSVSSFDEAALGAWFDLGFGRKSVCAWRSTARLEPEPAPIEGLEIEEIRGRDHPALERFHRRLMSFQTAGPMLWPYSGEADASVDAVRRKSLWSGQGFAFLAKLADEPVASLLFVPSVFLSPLLGSDRSIYLWEGYVDDGRRAAGVGTCLLAHALAALSRRGIESCSLHYVSGNPRGGRFWPAKGFVPVEATLKRHVDERVAWARGPKP